MSYLEFHQLGVWSSLPKSVVVVCAGLINADRESFFTEMAEQATYINSLAAMNGKFGKVVDAVLTELIKDDERAYFRLMALWLQRKNVELHLAEFELLIQSIHAELKADDFADFSSFILQILRKIATSQFILENQKILKPAEENFISNVNKILMK